MRVRFLGTGTSQGIPVIGCRCPVCSSADTKDRRWRCSALIQSNGANVLIDAGPDLRAQMLNWGPSALDGILLTHEHNDHTAGLDDIRPYNFMQDIPLKVYALPRVAMNIRKRFGYIFERDRYPGAPSIDLIEVHPGDVFSIGGVEVEALDIRHGSLPILGYRIGEMAYLTDVKNIPISSLERLRGVKVLVISALRRVEHHSHLTLHQALDWIDQVGVQRAYLIHLSHEMGLHRHVERELPKGVFISWDGLEIDLEG